MTKPSFVWNIVQDQCDHRLRELIVILAFAERPEGVQFRRMSGVRDALIRTPPF